MICIHAKNPFTVYLIWKKSCLSEAVFLIVVFCDPDLDEMRATLNSMLTSEN